ncbi:hypothetical protein [Actinomadura geliboluensis]
MKRSKPFERMFPEERYRFNTEVVGRRCGWPDLDAVLALLDAHPGWSICYYRNALPPITDHIGRHDPGIAAGSWVAHPWGDEYEGLGSPRWVAPTVAELAALIESGPPVSCAPPDDTRGRTHLDG